MDVFAHWRNGAYVLLEEGCDRDFERLVARFGPPDCAKPADWVETGLGIVPALTGVDRRDWRAIRDSVVATVTANMQEPTCPHCGNHPGNCMGDDD